MRRIILFALVLALTVTPCHAPHCPNAQKKVEVS